MSESIKDKPFVLPRKRRSTTSGITDKAAEVIKRRKTIEAKPDIATDETIIELDVDDKNLRDVARELDKIFSPKNFRGVVRAPADLMLASTGRKIWDLPTSEVDAMAETGSLCARHFVKTDPKWLALILFSMSVLTTYGGRAGMHYSEVKKEKQSKEKKPAPIEGATT